MPISIVDYTKLEKDPLLVGIYQNLLRQSDVLKVWPWTNIKGLTARGLRWDSLPTPDFRKLYGSFTDTTGTTTPVEESMAIYGSAFKEDKVLAKADAALFRDPVQQQLDMHALAIARGFIDNLINGDIDSEPDGFNGLYKRLSGGTINSRGSIYCGSSSTTTLDVLGSAANAKSFIRKLRIALKYANLGTNEGRSGAILMNENSWLGIQEAFLLSGYVLETVNIGELTWPAFMGIPFVDVGLKLDKSTEIILNTYANGGGQSDSTRIFLVRFGQPDGDVESPGSDGMVGIQLSPMEVLGPEDYNTYKRYDLQWVHGLSNIGDEYCVTMLYNLKFTL